MGGLTFGHLNSRYEDPKHLALAESGFDTFFTALKKAGETIGIGGSGGSGNATSKRRFASLYKGMFSAFDSREVVKVGGVP